MKNSRMKIMAVLFAISMTLAGCGDAMYELTDEEEAVIVNYAAQTVAKFNTYQQDGEVFVRTDILEGETSEDEQTDVQESPQDAADTEEPMDVDTSGAGVTANTSGQPQESVKTMTDALDLGVISADYVGYELCQVYESDEYFTVDAEWGSQLLVVKFDLVNTSSQALHIDILAMTPSFAAVIDGERRIPVQTTILLNDLSTYQADIEPEGTNETVLLFQVPEDVDEISNIRLDVTMNGEDFTINL